LFKKCAVTGRSPRRSCSRISSIDSLPSLPVFNTILTPDNKKDFYNMPGLFLDCQGARREQDLSMK
jgi:hypothetical protein